MLARDEHAAMRAPAEWQPGTPRRVFWALLTCALLVSLALPLVTLWRASAPGLAARACVWPAEPRAGALAQALIVVPASVALASAQGEAPAVQVVVTMPGMAMPTERMSVAGPPQRMQGVAVYMAPVVVSMPGAWVAHVTVRASGRPAWQEAVAFHARASDWAELPLSTQSAGAASLCMAAPPVAVVASQPPEQSRRAGQGTTW